MSTTFSEITLPNLDLPSIPALVDAGPFDTSELVDRASSVASRLTQKLPGVDSPRTRSRSFITVAALVLTAAAITLVIRRRRSSSRDTQTAASPTNIHRAA